MIHGWAATPSRHSLSLGSFLSSLEIKSFASVERWAGNLRSTWMIKTFSFGEGWNLFDYLCDPAVSVVVGLCLKGWLPDQELVGEHAQTPQVNLDVMYPWALLIDQVIFSISSLSISNLLVMGRPFNHLRGEVVERAAHGRASRVGCMNRPSTQISSKWMFKPYLYTPSKICNLDISANIQQQVLRLDVPGGCFLFWSFLQIVQMIVNVSIETGS